MKPAIRLFLLVLLAALTFGGSFTCHYHSGDDHDHPTNPPPK